MKERKHVTKGKITEGTSDGFSPQLSEHPGAPPPKLGIKPLGPKGRSQRARRRTEVDIESESLLDVPLHARSLEGLCKRERASYARARSVLASGGGVHSLLLKNVPLAGLGLYEALLARSWAVRFNDPEEMVYLTQIALELAQGFDARGYGAGRVADLQARAWGELANAYRVVDRLRSAQQAFGLAYALLQKGTGDPYLKARLFDLEASLLGKWREFPLALKRLTSLTGLYRDLGEPHLAGRTLIIRALYTFYSGEAEEAIQINEEGLELIDQQRDSTLLMLAIHNHLLFLVDLGLHTLAKRALFDNRRHLLYKDRVNALRLRGVEGRISYGLGKLVSAEIAFREVKEGLAKTGRSFYRALISLELAMVLMSQGKVEEAEKEVIAARDIFLSLEVYREYLGSLLYLEECFRRCEVTAELIETTVAFLWRKELQIRPRLLR